MKRFRKPPWMVFTISSVLLLLLQRAAQAQPVEPTFRLELDPGPFVCGGAIEGPAGTKVSFELTAVLVQEGVPPDDGAQGWSVSLGGEHVHFVPCTADIAYPSLKDCFFCGGCCTVVDPKLDHQGEGVVCADVLSFIDPKSFQGPGRFPLLKVSMEVTLPQQGSETARLAYVDGKVGASGKPLSNGVTFQGRRVSGLLLGECILTLRAVEEPLFLRGDCNQDGAVAGTVADAVFLLRSLFAGGDSARCLAACDANGDGKVFGYVTDAIYLLNFNFRGGAPPPLPFPRCGVGKLESDVKLGCQSSEVSCR